MYNFNRFISKSFLLRFRVENYSQLRVRYNMNKILSLSSCSNERIKFPEEQVAGCKTWDKLLILYRLTVDNFANKMRLPNKMRVKRPFKIYTMFTQYNTQFAYVILHIWFFTLCYRNFSLVYQIFIITSYKIVLIF